MNHLLITAVFVICVSEIEKQFEVSVFLVLVVSFVGEKNQDLYQLFRATLENEGDMTHLFSRRRRLRRKIKAGLIEPKLIMEGTVFDK